MNPQICPAIEMGPSGNKQGSYMFFCLASEKRIAHWALTELPMPQSIIDQVNQIRKNECDIKDLAF